MKINKKVLLFPPINGAYSELFCGLSPEVTAEKSGSYGAHHFTSLAILIPDSNELYFHRSNSMGTNFQDPRRHRQWFSKYTRRGDWYG